MEYIDKATNEVVGKLIVEELLADSWNDNEYIGADYDGLKKTKYKNRFTNLLLHEQNNLCCYCLKQIDLSKTTLEHLIPQEVSIPDFQSYLVVDELTNNVIHKTTFDKNIYSIPPQKYPHDIAYHNLLASCDSNLHCNNYRGNKTIAPFMFNNDISSLVKYDRAGNVDCEQYEDDFSKLGLSNASSPLKLIRLIWCKLSQGFNEINQITEEIIDDIIFELILLFDDSRIVDNFTRKPSYKEEVLKYQWFFNYYKRR